jgi:hypothetical protein
MGNQEEESGGTCAGVVSDVERRRIAEKFACVAKTLDDRRANDAVGVLQQDQRMEIIEAIPELEISIGKQRPQIV